MQTAFCEIVFYLHKQPLSHKLQTKMRSLLNSFHITRGICKYSWGAGASRKRGNWIKDSMRQDADYETETGRKTRVEERKRKSAGDSSLTKWAEKRWLPQTECHPSHRYPKEREKPLQYSPFQLTKECTTCSILLLTRQIPLTDSHSGAKKGILRMGQPKGKILHRKSKVTSSVGQQKSFTSEAVEVPHSLFTKQHHITIFCESWVMAYFHCFYFFSYIAGLIHRSYVRKISLFSLGISALLNIV